MTRLEATLGAVALGLLLSCGLVAWSSQDMLWNGLDRYGPDNYVKRLPPSEMYRWPTERQWDEVQRLDAMQEPYPVFQYLQLYAQATTPRAIFDGTTLPAQQEPPTQPGDPNDPHAGQPDHCTNAKDAPAAHKCECHKAEEEDGGKGCDVEDVKCKVYCRKDHCHCFHPKCDS